MSTQDGRKLWAARRTGQGIQLLARAREGATQAAPDDEALKQATKLTRVDIGRLTYMARRGDKDATAALARHAAKTDGNDAA